MDCKKDIISCPKCGSKEVAADKLSKLSSVLSFFVTQPSHFYFSKKKISYHCFDCYNDFER